MLHGAPKHFKLPNQLLARLFVHLWADGIAHICTLQLFCGLQDGKQVCLALHHSLLSVVPCGCREEKYPIARRQNASCALTNVLHTQSSKIGQHEAAL